MNMSVSLPVSIASRAALYLRVSTTRQAEVDLSIPDQRLQTKAYCERQGWQVVADYIEPGASAMDDQRPEFQRMIERASDDDRPFDVIVVHSFSRFFRDAFGLEMYIRRLAKHGVRLVSITQELGDDPSQVMMRQVIALFDEYQSRENAKHVLRAMKENARQGFYNGSRVPLGYAVEDVEQRGHRMRLYALVEDGVTDLDEVLKVRLADIKADRDRARSALDRIKGQSPAARIDRAKIERFGSLMRQNITTGDVPFRKAYLRSFIDAVEVDDRVIRIHGSRSTLEQAVIASSRPGKGVRSFVRKWRSLGESNPCFSLERAAS
jgi:DNA invertase Pin-like site-specific DNA recombinase